MKRLIVTPAVLPPMALAELKQWLGITTAHDDAPLAALLRAGLDLCEAFTGLMPLEAECEDTLPACTDWQRLSTRPVQAITQVESIAANGTRTALAVSAYAVDLDAQGIGRVRVTDGGAASRLAVRYVAGLASGWDQLPEALCHGLVRLAAHQHRERESNGANAAPPASVAALWRPWRQVRLA